MTLEYRSSFSYRYSSPYMRALFSEKERASTFRHLWWVLAKIEKKLGLDISDEACQQMQSCLYEIDLETIYELEKMTRHDVMAHILAFAKQCPAAAGIIHLGATSCYVTDNADVIIYKKALVHLLPLFKKSLRLLKDLIQKSASIPCVAYTHFQVAQPTTMGKRMSLWMQDLYHLYTKLSHFCHNLKLLGIKGATGSQSSFDVLFDHDETKLVEMESLFEEMLGMKSFPLSSQTYTRLQDVELLSLFSEIGASFHKIGTDIRLLSHTGELQEGFVKGQVGSSAMPHKKNPISSEKLCSLSRFLMAQQAPMAQTYALQWLERSLDDSAIRRVILPESFLALDECLLTFVKVLESLTVNEKVCLDTFSQSLKALSLEPILMKLSLLGYDRQKMHEKLKTLFLSDQDDLENIVKTLEDDLQIDFDEDFTKGLSDPSFYTKSCLRQIQTFLSTLHELD